MDYSLVVGVDRAKRELIVGVVDYIRTFTWSVFPSSNSVLTITESFVRLGIRSSNLGLKISAAVVVGNQLS
jgi:hypothetical protein